MTSLARHGYDLVIGVGFAQGDAIGKVAQKFPKTKFAIIDVDQAFVPGKPANVQGLLFREQEVGYLAGYLAGLEEKRRGGQGRDQRRRRHEGAAGRPLHRRLFRRRREGGAGDQDDPRLLPGLGRPGEVQGAGAEPDRARLAASSSRSPAAAGSARSNAAGERERLGDRRRRRPVVPRPPHPHERPEGSRLGRLPHDQVDPGRQLEGRRQRDLRPQGGGRRSRQGEPEGAAGGRRQGRRDRAADRGRRDHGDPDRGRQELSNSLLQGPTGDEVGAT